MKKALLTIAIASALSLSANAENKITAANVEGTAGSTVYVELKLANDAAVAGFQANLSADKSGLTLGTATKGARAITGDTWIGSNAVSGTSYNVLFYSQVCNTYTGAASETVAKIPVTIPAGATAGTKYTYTIQNGIVSNATGTTANCTSSTFTVTVSNKEKGDYDGVEGFDINDVNFLYKKYKSGSTDMQYNFDELGEFDINDVNALYKYYKQGH